MENSVNEKIAQVPPRYRIKHISLLILFSSTEGSILLSLRKHRGIIIVHLDKTVNSIFMIVI